MASCYSLDPWKHWAGLGQNSSISEAIECLSITVSAPWQAACFSIALSCKVGDNMDRHLTSIKELVTLTAPAKLTLGMMQGYRTYVWIYTDAAPTDIQLTGHHVRQAQLEACIAMVYTYIYT